MNDDVQVLGELLAQADRAADGPSNDDEIDCLRDALDLAVGLIEGLIESLGYQVPRSYHDATHVGETHLDGTPHVPAWSTVTHADVPADDPTFDVWCSLCGQSGSFALSTDDIQWI